LWVTIETPAIDNAPHIHDKETGLGVGSGALSAVRRMAQYSKHIYNDLVLPNIIIGRNYAHKYILRTGEQERREEHNRQQAIDQYPKNYIIQKFLNNYGNESTDDDDDTMEVELPDLDLDLGEEQV